MEKSSEGDNVTQPVMFVVVAKRYCKMPMQCVLLMLLPVLLVERIDRAACLLLLSFHAYSCVVCNNKT